MATIVLDDLMRSPWALTKGPRLMRRTDTVRVLFLIDQLCATGGAESALLNTVRWLPQRFRSSVMTFRLDSGLPMLADFPCPVQLLPLECTYDWNSLRRAKQLTRFIHEEEVDVVHTFFASADLWGGVVAKLSRRPILVSSRRDMGFERTTKHRIGYRFARGIFDKVLTVSEEVRQYSITHDRLDPERVKTIYTPVDIAKLEIRASTTELRERFGLDKASHVIATVANIRRVKGFEVLLRAAAIVCKHFPKAVFAIAGSFDTAEPGYFQELETLKQQLNLAENVKFLGPLNGVAGLLKASNAFCLLSRSEGLSNALLEAMACGVPCVASRVGGNAEALEEGRTGFLVESGDYEGAAAQVCALLRNPSLARQMGERGQKSMRQRFTPEIVTSQLVEVYDEMLAARKKDSRR